MEPSRLRERVRRVRRRVGRAIFGDRIGLAVFLGALVFFGLYWRIGFFINDSWTIANTMVAVSEGHLHVDRIVYGPESAATPGMHELDGRLYGRNYGHVFLSLPFLWFLQLSAPIVDPRILLAGGWSLLLLGFTLQAGAVVNQRTAFALVGSVAALVLFGLNVLTATPLDPRWFHLVALQSSTMAAAALTGVVLYRLLSRFHGPRAGVFAGGVVVLATPVGFWASIPKRHVLTALLAVLMLYGFAASRGGSSRSTTWHRALAYAAVGTTAWLHAAEAAIFFAVLAPVDLATASSNDRRTLAVVGGVFVLSVLPSVLTNALISGNPVKTPRLLPGYSGDLNASVDPSGGTDPELIGPGGSEGSSFGVSLPGLPAPVRLITGRLIEGAVVFVDSPSRLHNTFLRSGRLQGWKLSLRPAINLTLVESMPLLAAVLALPAAIGRNARRGTLSWPRLRTPERMTDVFAVVLLLVFSLLYTSRLPTHAQVTVRYLLPIVPLVVYLVARLPPIRRVVRTEGRLFLWAYAAFVLVGGQLAFLALRSMELTLGEAMQLHAVTGIVVASLVGIWATVDVLRDGIDERVGAVVLALVVSVSTGFLLATGLEYFPYGDFALGTSRALSDALDVLY